LALKTIGDDGCTGRGFDRAAVLPSPQGQAPSQQRGLSFSPPSPLFEQK